jgi:hypothetical protein|tara:strand:+ start:3969 stop:4106 length:138 start_codon:yes stop_codon:yes gene_type:complete
MNNWTLEIGLYPGVLIGARSYIQDDIAEHVLYIPFIEMCLTVERE